MPKSQPQKADSNKPKAASTKGGKPEAKPVAKVAAKPAAKADAKAPTKSTKAAEVLPSQANGRPGPRPPVKMTPFLKLQKERLTLLRDTMLDSMAGVAKDTLRSRPEGNEASAFGMHQADAGSDAYDKDFALSLLSQEQDALYEIEEALKRIDGGTYGVCEMSGKEIPAARLEALPFARLTVECQAEFERTKKFQRSRAPVASLFGLTDSDDDDGEEEAEEKPEKPQAEE
jgi:DnaK suppressor protein